MEDATKNRKYHERNGSENIGKLNRGPVKLVSTIDRQEFANVNTLVLEYEFPQRNFLPYTKIRSNSLETSQKMLKLAALEFGIR